MGETYKKIERDGRIIAEVTNTQEFDKDVLDARKNSLESELAKVNAILEVLQ